MITVESVVRTTNQDTKLKKKKKKQGNLHIKVIQFCLHVVLQENCTQYCDG